MNKLPDKGQKIREYFVKVQAELASRNEMDQAAEQFSTLNIVSIGRKAINNLEWTGNASTNNRGEVTVDSDDEPDDEEDPLKIIANANESQKIVKVLPPEKSLITEEDLQEIESFKSEPSVVEVGIKDKSRFNKLIQKMDEKSIQDENELNKVVEILEPHAIYLCSIENEKTKSPKLKFLPGRTTKTDVHNPTTEMSRKVHRNWEATAATPPLLRHSGVKTLSLEESIEVQRHQIEHVKKVQKDQAQDRLAQRQIRTRDRILLDNLVNDAPFFSDYRDKNDLDDADSDQEFNSDDEVYDEPDEKGGVVYRIEKSS